MKRARNKGRTNNGLHLAVCLFTAAVFILTAASNLPVFAAGSGSKAEVAAFIFPDGSVTSLCLGGQEGDKAPGTAPQHCFLCTHTKLAALPGAPEFSLAAPLVQKFAVAAFSGNPLPSVCTKNSNPRGPPATV